MNRDQSRALAWIDYRARDLEDWIGMCRAGDPVRAQYVLAHNELVNLRERITGNAPDPEGYKPATEPIY